MYKIRVKYGTKKVIKMRFKNFQEKHQSIFYQHNEISNSIIIFQTKMTFSKEQQLYRY